MACHFGGFLRMTLIGGGALFVLLTLLPIKEPQVLLTQPPSTFLVSSFTWDGHPRLYPQHPSQGCSFRLGSHPVLPWPLPHSHSHSQALTTPQGQSGLGWKEGVTGAGVEGRRAVCHKHNMALQEMETATAKVWRLKWKQAEGPRVGLCFQLGGGRGDRTA